MRAIIDSGYSDIRDAFIQAQMEPNCGWPWLEQNVNKAHPQQSITVFRDGKAILEVRSEDKEGVKSINKLIRAYK